MKQGNTVIQHLKLFKMNGISGANDWSLFEGTFIGYFTTEISQMKVSQRMIANRKIHDLV